MIDRVDIDELKHDTEQMRHSDLYNEYQRAAEKDIGYLDDSSVVVAAIENAMEPEMINLLKAVQQRDSHKIGEIVLQMIKQELVQEMLE